MARDLHETSSARDREEDAPEPPQIRRFRRLVSITMVAMVVGILGIMSALVWKLTQTPSSISGSVITGKIGLPVGYEIVTASRSGSSLFLVLKNRENGTQLLEERDADHQVLLRQFTLEEIKK